MLKRARAEWGQSLDKTDVAWLQAKLREIQVKGVQTDPIVLTPDAMILHIRVPSHWDDDQISGIANWFDRVRKNLPSNCFGLVTTDDLTLEVHRPDVEQRLKELEHKVDLLKKIVVESGVKEEEKENGQ